MGVPICRGRARAARRALSLGAAFLVLALLTTAAVAQVGFIDLTNLFFAEGGNTFGADDVITTSGATPPISTFPCRASAVASKARALGEQLARGEITPIEELIEMAAFAGSYSANGEDQFDFFPSADIYVIPNAEALEAGAPLSDVSGAPNRVIGTGAFGAFVEELVGIVAPSGNLKAGDYDIVLDHCEDGSFDPFLDIQLGASRGAAFRVYLPGDVAVDLGPLKRAAKLYSLGLNGGDLEEAVPGAPPYDIPDLCGVFDLMIKAAKNANRVSGSFASLASQMLFFCGDLAARWKGIAADPPDAAFTDFAALEAVSYDFDPVDNDLDRALRRLTNTMAEQVAISQAFLTTLERFQGARAAEDDEFMSLQLEHLNQFILLLRGSGGNLFRFYAALEAFEVELRKAGLDALPEAAPVPAAIREVRRGIGGLLRPLGPSFIRDLNTLDDVLPFGLQAYVIVLLGLQPFLNDAGLFSIADIRDAKGLPPIAFQHPVVATTGPYTAPPGRDISFDASLTTDPQGDALVFSWDLDGDGAFDDGDGEQLTASFPLPGTRLVGVKATDPDGNGDVAYVLLKIGDRSRQDIVTVASSSGRLRRVTSEGVVSTIRENALPLGASPLALQLDLDEHVFILTENTLFHLDPDGVVLDTKTPADIGALVGREFSSRVGPFQDLALDGRGDFILAVAEAPGPGDLVWGPVSLLRLTRDLASASIIAEGIRHSQGSFGRAGIAFDPEGNIVVSALADPDAVEDPNLHLEGGGSGGVSHFDPDDGSATEVLPADGAFVPELQTVELVFGGNLLGVSLVSYGSRLDHGGIVVDPAGNYIMGTGGASNLPDLIRVPIPPELSGQPSGDRIPLHLEVFPLIPTPGPGSLELNANDIGIDAAGDAVLVAWNSGTAFPSNHIGAWHVSPAGEIFLIGDLGLFAVGTNQGREAFDLTRPVRDVKPKDVPAPPLLPILQLDALAVDPADCPASVRITTTLTNQGGTSTEPPTRAYFYDGDPLGGGLIIGAAVVDSALAPGESAELSVVWPQPTPGFHEVHVFVAGANPAFAALGVCAPEPRETLVDLAPVSSSPVVGTTHTVHATVLDPFGRPLAGLLVGFEVGGANPAAGESLTDANGEASFSYTGNNAGDDAIVATFYGVASMPVSVGWQPADPREPCDVDRNGEIDKIDVDAIFAARGSPASGPDDARDADGDGLITLIDGRICVLQCTNENCATTPRCGLLGIEPLCLLAVLWRRRRNRLGGGRRGG